MCVCVWLHPLQAPRADDMRTFPREAADAAGQLGYGGGASEVQSNYCMAVVWRGVAVAWHGMAQGLLLTCCAQSACATASRPGLSHAACMAWHGLSPPAGDVRGG